MTILCTVCTTSAEISLCSNAQLLAFYFINKAPIACLISFFSKVVNWTVSGFLAFVLKFVYSAGVSWGPCCSFLYNYANDFAMGYLLRGEKKRKFLWAKDNSVEEFRLSLVWRNRRRKKELNGAKERRTEWRKVVKLDFVVWFDIKIRHLVKIRHCSIVWLDNYILKIT